MTNTPSTTPMDFVAPVAQHPQPTPSYELTKDVTGKPPEKRGVFVLVDKNGTEVKLPYKPKAGCNKCFGRGHRGVDIKSGKFVICRKCYKMI